MKAKARLPHRPHHSDPFPIPFRGPARCCPGALPAGDGGHALPRLLKEFHDHRLGATIEDATYHRAEQDFFDDVVSGADARREEIDLLIIGKLAKGWTLERLERPMRAILRAGTYELIARPDVPVGR